MSSADADDAVIARVLAGDRTAFNVLFDRYSEYVYNIVLGVVGRRDEARDVTQEVFLQVYRSLGTFRRGARFATWLYRVALNRAVDAARRDSRRRWLPFDEGVQDHEDPADGPEEQASRDSHRDDVQKVLMQVAPNHRDVLVLRYFQEMSVEDIADVLGCSADTAKVRLFRARKHFKDAYVRTFGEDAAVG